MGFSFFTSMVIDKLYTIFMASTGICTDTRKITEGCLFFALKGANFNGNIYAFEALAKGASKVVVDDPLVAKDDSYILVEDTLKTLQQLATYHRKKLGIPIIGITGTNGKTTTKELTSAVLSQKYKVCFTQGNLNNHIGVPLTLLSMDSDTEMGVVEMGANHPGEIKQLCDIALPDYGIITNVGKAHLEGFGSFEGVKQTKAELYHFLRSNQGSVFINGTNDMLLKLAENTPSLISYGNENSDVKGMVASSQPFVEVHASIGPKELHICTKLIGSYNLENILAALCIGNHFKVALNK